MVCPTECKVELERRVKKSTVLIITLALLGAIGSVFVFAISDRVNIENKVSAAETKVQRTTEDVSEIAIKQDGVMVKQGRFEQAIVDIRTDVAEIKQVNQTILHNQVKAVDLMRKGQAGSVQQMREMIKEALDKNGR